METKLLYFLHTSSGLESLMDVFVEVLGVVDVFDDVREV